MDASTLKKVTSNLNRGGDYRPAAGVVGDRVGSLAQGTAGVGPGPSPAANSGTKLDSGYLLTQSHNRSNGQLSEYDGTADFDEDDQVINGRPQGDGSGAYPLPRR